jgi:Protein of unknown function (DUF1573)
MKGIWICVFFSLFLTVSTNAQTTKKSTKTAATSKTATKKNTKVNAKTDESVVSVGVPKTTATKKARVTMMKFDKEFVDFGKINMGDDPKFVYNFTNIGNEDLIIELVSGCDCTELDWTRDSVKPGATGMVSAIYHSKKTEPEDIGKQLKKDVTIILKNNYPNTTQPFVEEVKFNVFVNK